MVDAHALGACGLGRAGSNPASPTKVRFCTMAMCRVGVAAKIKYIWRPVNTKFRNLIITAPV